MVKYKVERLTGEKVGITIKHIEDFRNYKVAISRAKMHLGFQPQYTVAEIIENLYENSESFKDYEDDRFYNIRVFKKLATH